MYYPCFKILSVFGLCINLGKSSLISINIEYQFLEVLAGMAGCAILKWPLSYYQFSWVEILVLMLLSLSDLHRKQGNNFVFILFLFCFEDSLSSSLFVSFFIYLF